LARELKTLLDIGLPDQVRDAPSPRSRGGEFRRGAQLHCGIFRIRNRFVSALVAPCRHEGRALRFQAATLTRSGGVSRWTAFPDVPRVRSHAPARASAVHSRESLAVKADRSALSLGAGSVRRGRNSRRCFRVIPCARQTLITLKCLRRRSKDTTLCKMHE